MKPMLAATLKSLEDAQFPVYVQPKLDGIRCLIHNGIAVSRKLKPIPNKYIQEKLKGLPDGLDGELMVKGDFNDVQSAVMSPDGEPDFTYCMFDYISNDTYTNRWFNQKLCPQAKNKPVIAIETFLVTYFEQLQVLENDFIKQGYEGIILRSPGSPYKFGRSGVKEGYLLKYKRFLDDEGIVIGFDEKMHNANEAEKDLLGRTKRSSKKAGLEATGMLGSLVVSWKDKEFNIGTGFTDKQRKEIWNNRKRYLNMPVTFVYQEVSQYGIPRFPVFKGFRLENI